MPRYWAEAYRIDEGRVGVRVFRASWWRPWRATHVMEVRSQKEIPNGRTDLKTAWVLSDSVSKLVDVSVDANAAAGQALLQLLKAERRARIDGLWIPIVPQPRMRLLSDAVRCLGPEVCGAEADHVIGCPIGQLGTAGMGPR